MIEAAIVLMIGMAALGLSVLGLILEVLRRRLCSTRNLPVTAEWIDNLSVERYRPMLRLLDEQDIRFWRRQPDYTHRAERDLRRRRARIFRGYLNNLQMDFSRICVALQIILSNGQHNRTLRVSAVLDAQLKFICAVAAVRFRMLLYRWSLGTTDGAALLNLFDSLRLDLRVFVPDERAKAA